MSTFSISNNFYVYESNVSMFCVALTLYCDGALLYQFEVCDIIQTPSRVVLDFRPDPVGFVLVYVREYYLNQKIRFKLL